MRQLRSGHDCDLSSLDPEVQAFSLGQEASGFGNNTGATQIAKQTHHLMLPL